MKKLCVIIVLSLVSCTGSKFSLLPGAKLKQHTEIKRVFFNIENNELVWSRMHYYVHVCLGYPPGRFYNPYVIHVRSKFPLKVLTIAREIEKERVRIIIAYTCKVKSKKVEDVSKNVKYVNDPEEVMKIKNKLADMIEYAGTGKHKNNPGKDVKIKDKENKTIKDEDFYPF